MPRLKINGKDLVAKEAETVLEVCQREGIHIPTLCYYRDLKPYGGCRLCIVEVEGMANPMTACTLPAAEAMVIKTDTELLRALRRFTLELILSEHPHSCLVCNKKEECEKFMECIQKEPISFGCKYCGKDGSCELQRLVDELGIKEVRFGFQYRGLEIEGNDPFFERNYNLCILCGRCVRACAELRNASVIDFHHRGPKTLVSTPFDLTHLEADCQFCGACVDLCPTGAMIERYSKWQGRPERSIASSCPLCSVGCDIRLNVKDNMVTSSEPDRSQLCVRGRFGIGPLVHHRRRITTPLLRKDQRLVEVEWQEALDFAGSKLREHKEKTAIIFSPGLTIEAIDALDTFSEIIGAGELGCLDPVPRGFKNSPLSFSAEKIALVIVGTDMITDFSVLFLKIKRLTRQKDMVLIAIDPIQTKTAESADLWLRPSPGMENKVLDLLFTERTSKNNTGISFREIARTKRLLKGREIYLFYNPFNTGNLEIPRLVKEYPLVSSLNCEKINQLNISAAQDLLTDKDIECLYLIGASPLLNRRLKTVIVQDCFLPAFEFDLFLPAATFAETDGNFIDMEGKTKKIRKAIEPLGSSRSDEWIIKEITQRLEFDLVHQEKEKVKKSKITGEKIKPSKGYPFYMIVRENCYRFRSQPLSSLLKGFKRLRDDDCLWMNPADARNLRFAEGTEVRITGKRFKGVMRIKISDRVPAQVLFAYHNPALGLQNGQAVYLESLGVCEMPLANAQA